MANRNVELDDLLDALCERGLGQSELDRIEAIAADDPADRATLVELIQLDAIMRWESSNLERHVPLAIPTSARVSPAAASVAPKSRFSLRRLSLACAAALLIAGAAVAVYVQSPGVDARSPSPSEANPIAMLVDADTTVVVNGALANRGDAYSAGEYAIDAGEAALMLNSRVLVKLEGKTRLLMHDPMHATLQRGTASFDVPTEAIGFVVQLPDGSRIVDLGTAFRVEVDKDGRANVRVTDGKVQWEPGSSVAPPVELAAGQAARVIDGELVLTSVPLFAESFEVTRSDTAAGVESLVPHNWVASTKIAGFGWDRKALVSQASGGFTTPFGDHGYQLNYANAALTTGPDAITDPLTAGLAYTVSFHVANTRGERGSTYRVELVAFDAAADRADDETGVVLDAAEGRVTTNDMSATGSIVFEPAPTHLNLGDAIAIRLIGATNQSVVFDNITLTVEPANANGKPGPTNAPTKPASRPSEPADRSDGDRDSEGPSSETKNPHIGEHGNER